MQTTLVLSFALLCALIMSAYAQFTGSISHNGFTANGMFANKNNWGVGGSYSNNGHTFGGNYHSSGTIGANYGYTRGNSQFNANLSHGRGGTSVGASYTLKFDDDDFDELGGLFVNRPAIWEGPTSVRRLSDKFYRIHGAYGKKVRSIQAGDASEDDLRLATILEKGARYYKKALNLRKKYNSLKRVADEEDLDVFALRKLRKNSEKLEKKGNRIVNFLKRIRRSRKERSPRKERRSRRERGQRRNRRERRHRRHRRSENPAEAPVEAPVETPVEEEDDLSQFKANHLRRGLELFNRRRERKNSV